MSKRLQIRARIFGIFFQEADQKFIFGLSKKTNNGLISRIIDIDIELTKKHFLLLLLIIVFAILLGLAVLEHIFLAHGRHLRSLSFPLCFDINDTTDIIIS